MAMPPMSMPPTSPAGSPSLPMGPMPATGDMPPMHTSFFWGHRVQVLFSNWPGDRDGVGMYVLCLLVVAVLAALVEVLSAAFRALSHRSGNALLVAGIHAVKMGLSYMVMLAIMSFNGGVFLAILAGHVAGLLLSRRWKLGPATRRDNVPITNGSLPSVEPKP